jgi:hypothetical protein
VEEYERLSRLEHGDISWIVPGKFIAFSGPLSNRRELSPGVFTLLPQEYVKLFQRLGVTCVIRFNNKCYDRKVFTRAGIRHVDLFYEDGGNPTDAILQVQCSTQYHFIIAIFLNDDFKCWNYLVFFADMRAGDWSRRGPLQGRVGTHGDEHRRLLDKALWILSS